MMSLKNRLIGAAVLWIVVGMLSAGFALSAIFREHVTQQFYDELYVHLDELQRLVNVGKGGQAKVERQLSDPRYDVDSSGFYWEVQRNDHVLARSESLKGGILKTPVDDAADAGVHTHEIDGPTGSLIVAERSKWTAPDGPPVRYIIGTDRRHLETVLASFNNMLILALGLLGLTMALAAAVLITFAMRPFAGMREALMRVRSGQEKRLSGQFPPEVQPLADDLNTLLASSSDLIQRARTQAGNLAHGLKTPLAILTDEAHKIAEQGLEQSSKTIFEQCSRMQTQINFQITRARAVAMRAVPGTVASVAKAASEVTSALSRLYRDRMLNIDNDIADPAKVACDPQDLNEMLANLVDNACKHAKEKVRISVAPGSPSDLLQIIVEDDGPGLPPEAYDIVFDIGQRWDSQKPGGGLGLAIVRDLARLYGGDISLHPSKLGGLAAILELPRLQDAC
ncbi:conserved exported protein of unknown function [Candidatus Filomicrobium marinum]|uniref:histidine kinase n=2 Tax=Filomicrobium TaxID=119044 RepID=A0A0D6JDC7_9HYPH|nr:MULTISPECIES: HAMP domain-containing sensor histidine kinase [Filomicrobium]CFX14384.1 conserved exported protein of unknown function [Candidatus Filomicrobium marinum]CPR17782.1 conserved exported protein of unknown function [Candidatus Filomicrobium marinum]SDO28078.1 Signal transduction histidine kinase [Filomicrobium insigne]